MRSRGSKMSNITEVEQPWKPRRNRRNRKWREGPRNMRAWSTKIIKLLDDNDINGRNSPCSVVSFSLSLDNQFEDMQGNSEWIRTAHIKDAPGNEPDRRSPLFTGRMLRRNHFVDDIGDLRRGLSNEFPSDIGRSRNTSKLSIRERLEPPHINREPPEFDIPPHLESPVIDIHHDMNMYQRMEGPLAIRARERMDGPLAIRAREYMDGPRERMNGPMAIRAREYMDGPLPIRSREHMDGPLGIRTREHMDGPLGIRTGEPVDIGVPPGQLGLHQEHQDNEPHSHLPPRDECDPYNSDRFARDELPPAQEPRVFRRNLYFPPGYRSPPNPRQKKSIWPWLKTSADCSEDLPDHYARRDRIGYNADRFERNPLLPPGQREYDPSEYYRPRYLEHSRNNLRESRSEMSLPGHEIRSYPDYRSEAYEMNYNNRRDDGRFDWSYSQVEAYGSSLSQQRFNGSRPPQYSPGCPYPLHDSFMDTPQYRSLMENPSCNWEGPPGRNSQYSYQDR